MPLLFDSTWFFVNIFEETEEIPCPAAPESDKDGLWKQVIVRYGDMPRWIPFEAHTC